jgi:leucyl-tRNA synthetase
VGTILGDKAVPSGDTARSYAEELLERRQELGRTLGPEAEHALLDRASWLLCDEFDAEVTVRRADADSERAETARPGKPAVHIR